MGYRILKKNFGQGTLEISIVLIILVLLIGGIINIWLWGNTQIVKRQIRYNQSRVQAGRSSDDYGLVWPPPNYHPDDLTESKVLPEAPEITRPAE